MRTKVSDGYAVEVDEAALDAYRVARDDAVEAVEKAHKIVEQLQDRALSAQAYAAVANATAGLRLVLATLLVSA